VSIEDIESALNHIMHRLRSTGERELPSRAVGEEVMQELKEIDAVAYVRFASVYRDFQDVSEFQEEIRRLKRSATDGTSADTTTPAKTGGDED
jgi:transcriptional repressor NrdR